MDTQFYQKMFESPQPQIFPSMNPSSAIDFQQQQLLFQQCLQQQQAMAQFYNPFFFLSANQNLMNGQQDQQQQRYRRDGLQRAPGNPASSMPSFNPSSTAAAPWMPTNSSPFSGSASSSSDGGSTKQMAEAGSPRDIFFKTLSFSLKEAQRQYNNNRTAANWKNPFLYKTTLCKNYSNRSFCRFGVNCWYAHGHHELRCIPDSKGLPDPEFIKQYLSFLGLPAQSLERMIQTAYSIATNSSPPPSASTAPTPSPCSSGTSCFFTPSSSLQQSPDLSFFPSTPLSHSPIKAIAASTPNTTALHHPKPDDKFYSSLTANIGASEWGGIESAAATKDAVDVKNNDAKDGNGKTMDEIFGHAYNLFGAIGDPW